MTDFDLKRLHGHSTLNRHAIESSDQIGCFNCERIWDPLQFHIKKWIDETDSHGVTNATALCPFCGIDAILAKLSAGKITVQMLDLMHRRWFDK
jgi:hypothetical protein